MSAQETPDRTPWFFTLATLAALAGAAGAYIAVTRVFLPGLTLMVLAPLLVLVAMLRARRVEQARNDARLQHLMAGGRDAEHAARLGDQIDAGGYRVGVALLALAVGAVIALATTALGSTDDVPRVEQDPSCHGIQYVTGGTCWVGSIDPEQRP